MSQIIKIINNLFRGFVSGVGLAFGILATGLAAVTISGTINSFSSGEVVSASAINENFATIRSAIEGLPDCSSNRVILTSTGATQTIGDGVTTALTLYSETSDIQNMHDSGTPSRITIQQDGMYLISSGITFDVNTTGTRELRIHVNGAQVRGAQLAAATSQTQISMSTVQQLSSGDYVELYGRQTSGAALNVNPQEFSAVRLCGD